MYDLYQNLSACAVPNPMSDQKHLNKMPFLYGRKNWKIHHGMGISGNRSSTTNIFCSDSFGISVIYTFWAIHPCKNNHLPISFRAVIVNSNLSNLFLTITALKMILCLGFLRIWIGKKMKNTEIPKYKAKNNVGSTASVARSSMVKMKIKNNA